MSRDKYLGYTKINALVAASVAVATDILPVLQSGDNQMKTLTLAQVVTLVESGGFSSATPSLDLIDTDTDDDDVSATIAANATATGTGVEDVDLLYRTQINGVMTTHMSFDADDGSGALALQTIPAGKIGFFGTTPVVRTAAFTPTNVTPDRAYDADTVAVAELADVVGTIIADLQSYGLLQ